MRSGILSFRGFILGLVATVAQASSLAASPRVLVLNETNAPPFSNLERSGFYDVVVGEALRRAGFELRIVSPPAGRALQLSSDGVTDGELNRNSAIEADYPNLVGATGAYLSSFTIAVTEVTERANLPVLTLSYSDLITERDFDNVFQTSATSGAQAEIALPIIMDLAEEQTGTRPSTVAVITDNTAASLSSVERMKEGLFDDVGLELVSEEVFTPPLADATSLIQEIRARRPDLLFFRKDRLGHIGEKAMLGPPDLAVEVISDSSAKIDRVDKFEQYAAEMAAQVFEALPGGGEVERQRSFVVVEVLGHHVEVVLDEVDARELRGLQVFFVEPLPALSATGTRALSGRVTDTRLRVLRSRKGVGCCEIPRTNDFEDSGGPFFLDAELTRPDPLLDVFDCPDASQSAPVRSASLSALQALALWNTGT